MKTGFRKAPAALFPIALLSSAFLSSLCAWAQTPQTPPSSAPAAQRIAVINMQEALVSTNDGKKAVADLRAKYGPKDADFQKRGQDIQARQEQYRKTQATLSDEQKAKMERDIDTLTHNLQRDADDEKQDRDQDEQRVLQDLGGKMMQVISKYAADNHYTLVFDVAGQPNNILFASNAADITRDVIALYDKAAPVTPTAAPAPASKPGPSPAKPPVTPAPKP